MLTPGLHANDEHMVVTRKITYQPLFQLLTPYVIIWELLSHHLFTCRWSVCGLVEL